MITRKVLRHNYDVCERVLSVVWDDEMRMVRVDCGNDQTLFFTPDEVVEMKQTLAVPCDFDFAGNCKIHAGCTVRGYDLGGEG